jgi:hypothetical protein
LPWTPSSCGVAGHCDGWPRCHFGISDRPSQRPIGGGLFRRGTLAERLLAADLPHLEPGDLRLLGVAIAHRAMRDTFVIQEEGVEACASDPRADIWPAAHREGVAEGLFLDREGLIDANIWGVRQAAVILAAHPDAAAVITDLDQKIRAANWSYVFRDDPNRRQAVVAAGHVSCPHGCGSWRWERGRSGRRIGAGGYW